MISISDMLVCADYEQFDTIAAWYRMLADHCCHLEFQLCSSEGCLRQCWARSLPVLVGLRP